MSQLKVWIIDHRDSFTYNLAELLRSLHQPVSVIKNEEALPRLSDCRPDLLILSPGPGIVTDAKHAPTFSLLEQTPPSVPVLGICLGHQIIGTFFGATLAPVHPPLHGVEETAIQQADDPLFHGIPAHFPVGLYHSWRLSRDSMPDCLAVTSADREGHILSFKHKTKNMRGVQFHPESFLTAQGAAIMQNCLDLARRQYI